MSIFGTYVQRNMKYINVLSTRVQNTKKYKILIEHMYKIQKYREKIPKIEYKSKNDSTKISEFQ